MSSLIGNVAEAVFHLFKEFWSVTGDRNLIAFMICTHHRWDWDINMYILFILLSGLTNPASILRMKVLIEILSQNLGDTVHRLLTPVRIYIIYLPVQVVWFRISLNFFSEWIIIIHINFWSWSRACLLIDLGCKQISESEYPRFLVSVKSESSDRTNVLWNS